MDLGRIGRGELLAALGGVLLAVGVLLPWYGTSRDNPNAVINGASGTFSAWEAHPILRWLLLAAAAAPVVLLWIVVRDHELSWPRGEMTAVVAIAAFGLVSYSGLVDRPGDPSGEISLKIGWLVAMAGVILMAIGGAMRAATIERRRKPPGVM
jgi:hypothetical protein